jgi:hypothetical protein
METLVNIILLEGVNITEKNENEICLCHRDFTLFSLFPINYLNPLLQLIINNRNETNMNNPLYLGYNNYDKSFKYKKLNIKIDINLEIVGTVNNKDIIFKYKSPENRFPICWLNDDIKKLIYEQ